ncbi:FxLYD domain-containing protein [Pyrinomonas sp.]|uniref:FxLYD domain-containing protein n=1 Tax=Pyrinomonas sp. TaxID=2080306 RepID=UPI00332FA386
MSTIFSKEGTGKREWGKRAIAVCCALVASAALVSGYFYLQHRNQQRWDQQQTAVPPPSPPLALILVDEARTQKDRAVISGTVVNRSTSPLEKLSVEVELVPRAEGAVEIQSVPLVPTDLAPGEKGHFTLIIPARLWVVARPIRLRSGSQGREIAFESNIGERRPPSPPHLPGQPPRVEGSDFINTPDNPVSIP